MAYRIAGIDVHKRMLAIVVADVHVEGEYQFETTPFWQHPRAAAIIGGMAAGADGGRSGDGIHGSILETGLGNIGAVLEAGARSGKVPALFRQRCIWRRRNLIVGGEDEREISPTPNDW